MDAVNVVRKRRGVSHFAITVAGVVLLLLLLLLLFNDVLEFVFNTPNLVFRCSTSFFMKTMKCSAFRMLPGTFSARMCEGRTDDARWVFALPVPFAFAFAFGLSNKPWLNNPFTKLLYSFCAERSEI